MFVLAAANIAVKIIGLIYKIPLQHLIGDEGMGYFNSAYTIYTWLYIIATGGMPVAVSLLVSEYGQQGNAGQIRKIFRVTLHLLALVGLFAAGIMVAVAYPASKLIGSESSAVCMIAVAPTLFFICISSSIRGYYQGLQNMIPTAVSQVLEALGKLAGGIFLAAYAVKCGYDLPYVAGYAGFGITVGAAAGAIFLLGRRFFFGKHDHLPCRSAAAVGTYPVLGRLIKIALPVMLSSSVSSLTNLIDLTVTVRRLEIAGYTENAAMALYGNYTTLVVPMFNLPPILVVPIAGALVPVISAAVTEGNVGRVRQMVSCSLRMAAVISVPCVPALAFFARPILSLLYSGQSAALGAPMLVLIAPSVFLLCFVTVTNAALQAVGKVRIPLLSMAAGGCVKLVLSFTLVGIPGVGIAGSPIGTFGCYLTAAVINLFFLEKNCGGGLVPGESLGKPFLSAVLCVASALLVRQTVLLFSGETVALAAAVVTGIVIYAASLYFIGGLDDILLRLCDAGIIKSAGVGIRRKR